jgi:glycine C-acetyltransferase
MESQKVTQNNTESNKNALELKASDFFKPVGKNIFTRTHNLISELDIQKKYQLWLYFKTAIKSPSATSKGHDVYGNYFEGPNFATQDYLGLASNKSTHEESIRVIKEFGIHAGGAALAFGTHPWYLDFQKEIGDYMGVENVIIYSTGWMAGYGCIKGLIRDYDHIVMDRLAHNCLQEGAKASTKNVHITEHLDDKAMVAKIKQLREENPEGAILVITESLYSMDSDTPDLVFLQKECKKYDAFLLIDMAHDLGAIGEVGRGALETQNLTDLSNVILLGSGSKVLGTNIGFVGCSDSKVIEYMRYFSPPYMFSNVVAPPQCAAALHNLRIVRSVEGLERRKKVMSNAKYLIEKLTEKGFECVGNPSPIVIVVIGDEIFNRIVARLMLNKGVIVNGIEFPIVPKGKARLRLQLQAIHTKEHLDTFIEKVVESRQEGQQIMDNLSTYMKMAEAKAKL